jgi:general secretion pathway protein F
MPTFAFCGIDSAGRRRRGVVSADNLVGARASLREQGLVVLSLQKSRQWRTVHWSAKERLLFIQQMGQLLRAGLPVFDSLEAIEQRSRGASFHPILLGLLQEVRQGQSLSEGMGRHPQHFDGLMRALIAAGELSGTLPDAIGRLETLLVRSQKIRAQIRQALTYPAVVLSVAVLIVIFLLLVAVPALEPLLEGRPVEGLTAVLLGTSRTLRDYGLEICVGVGLFGVGVWSWLSSPAGKRILVEAMARTPLIGKAFMAGSLARFFRTFLTLVHGDLSVLDGLRMARQVVPVPSFNEAVHRIERGLIQGAALSSCVEAEILFPPIVSKMLSLSQESGELLPSLEQLAILFEEETETRVNRLQQMLQPLILVVLGLVVGVILMGILLPLTDVQQLVGGAHG